jgi:thiamine biosynthesis lipoprotein
VRRSVAAFTLFLFIIFGYAVYSQSLNSQQELFNSAQKKQFPVLLIFSGSVWCLPCQWLEKRIFSDSSFQDFARHNLMIIKADFPQRKKLSSEQILANQKLAEEFNPEGEFPRFLLIKHERTVLTLLVYENYSPEDFFQQIKEALQFSGML